MSIPQFPHFELKRVDSDGTESAPEVVPITRWPWDAPADRRGFLGAGVAAASVLGLLGGTASGQQPREVRQRVGARTPSGSAVLRAHAGPVKSLAFTPEGAFLVSGSTDETVKLWPLRSGGRPRSLLADGSAIHALAVTPDGTLLAAGGTSDAPLRLWSLPDGALAKTLREPLGAVTALAVTPDGKTLVAGLARGTIKLRALPDGTETRAMSPHFKAVHALAVLPRTNQLASGSADASINLAALPGGRFLRSLGGHAGSIHALAATPDGKLLASGSSGGKVELWSLPTGDHVRTFEGGQKGIHALAVTPDGTLLACGAGDGVVTLWTLPVGNEPRALPFPGAGQTAVESLAVAPDGNSLAAGYSNGAIVLWDLMANSARGFLFDPGTAQADVLVYNTTDNTSGRTITYTLPCGSPVPAGAVCTCNCVPGAEWSNVGQRETFAARTPMRPPAQDPVRPALRSRRGRVRGDAMPDDGVFENNPPASSGPPIGIGPGPGVGGGYIPFTGGGGMVGGGTYCTCNKVCVCIPVCQAHKLLHPCHIVRSMAEELLLVMGAREVPYMAWAAERAEPGLRRRIREVMAAVRRGASSAPSRWPTPDQCEALLDDPDDVIALMAAQMLRLLGGGGKATFPGKAERLLIAAARRPWYAPGD